MLLAIALGTVSVGLYSANQDHRPIQENDKRQIEDRSNVDGSASSEFSDYVDDEGNISLPTGFRQNWTHLGSWAVARRSGADVFEIHDVYTAKETIDAYNKNGEFPDGAALVKEVRNAESARLTSGHSAWATDQKIWFVMIKDRKERFPDNDHWGDGWGWALFEAKDPATNVSVNYQTSCLGCHRPAKNNDWLFVQGYPELVKPEINQKTSN